MTYQRRDRDRLALLAMTSFLLLSPGQAQQTVNIHRDVYGVPHVFATSDGGAFYGAGRASAEDRLGQMYISRLRYRGRTAEYLTAGTIENPTLYEDHDLAARVLGWRRHAERVYAAMPPEQQDLLQRYADGVNAHIATLVESPEVLKAHAIPLEAWSPIDCLGVWYDFASQFQGQGIEDAAARKVVDRMRNLGSTNAEIIDHFVGDNRMDDAAAAVQQSDISASRQAEMTAFAQQWAVPTDWQAPLGVYEPSFSEAFAVAGSRVAAGGAVLVGLPRVPVRSPNPFLELHMVGRSFDVRGACVPGTPFLLVGSSDRMAWSATALGLDMSDCYKLVVDDPDNPTGYHLDSAAPIPWDEVANETVLVRGGNSFAVTYRRCFWGPVVSDLVEIPGEHYAIKGVPLDRVDTSELTGFLAMYRARTVTQFHDATEHWRFPSVNLVFAGPNGRIGYTVVGAIPVRVSSQFMPGRYALDGDTAANDWKAIVPHHLRPHVIDPAAGFTYSGNHLPIGSWYPLKALVPGAGDTNRSRIVRDLLTAQPTFTDGELEAMVGNAESAFSRDIVAIATIADAQRQAPNAPWQWQWSGGAAAALAELQGWLAAGASMRATHPGVAVAHFLNQTLVRGVPELEPLVALYGGRPAGMSLWLRETRRWLAPPHNGVYRQDAPGLDPTTRDHIADIAALDWLLANAWSDFKAAPESPVDMSNQTWTTWYSQRYLAGSLRRYRSIDGHGPLLPGTIPFSGLVSSAGAVLADQRNAAFNQFVPLRAADLARSTLALGQSEAPGSAHELDQMPLWTTATLKSSPTTLAGIQAMGPYTTASYQIP